MADESLTHKEKWHRRMLEKYGSDEAIKEFMSHSAKQVKHRGGGGFKHMQQHDPDRLKEISRKALEKRYNNRANE